MMKMARERLTLGDVYEKGLQEQIADKEISEV
jgi:hypothetical protein